MVRGQQVAATKATKVQARKSVAKPAVVGTPTSGKGKISDCVACGVVIGPDSRALQCEKCDQWKCADCLGLPLELYTALVGGAGAELQWHCDRCREEGTRDKDESGEKLDRILELVMAVFNRTEEMERRLTAVEVSLSEKAGGDALGALEERLRSLDEMVRAPGRGLGAVEAALAEKAGGAALGALEERLRSLEELVRAPGRGNRPIHSDNPQRSTATEEVGGVEKQLQELEDRERRKTNLVVFNIPELAAGEVDEKRCHDIRELEMVLHELKVKTTLSNPVRLGPKKSDMKYPRPLRITVENEAAKWSILKEAKNLKDAGEEKMKNVFFRRDMTLLERQADADLMKALRAKREEETQSGGTAKYKIWKGKVVQLKKQD